jgi:hypothetical protein
MRLMIVRWVQRRPPSPYIASMCGRFTRNYMWQQIHALYRLTAPAAIPNFQPRFNVCPTDPADRRAERRRPRAQGDALGPGALLVEQGGGPESESPRLRNNSGLGELSCHEPEI